MDAVMPRTAFEWMCQAMTQGGKIPLDIARYSLTPLERIFLDVLRTKGYIALQLDDLAINECPYVLVVYHKNFRVGIKEWSRLSEIGDSYLFFVELTSEDWRYFTEARGYFFLEQEYKLREVTAFLEREHAKGTLLNFLKTLQDTLYHLAPLVVFVEDTIYSSEAYWGNNLIDERSKNSFMSELCEIPPSSWPIQHQQFVFAIHILLLTGGAYRLEAMNWMQLDPITLEEFLDRKANIYSSLIIDDLRHDYSILSLEEKARRLKELEQKITFNFQLLRVINGASLNKQIKCLPHANIQPEMVPNSLLDDLATLFPEVDNRTNWDSYFQLLAVFALQTHRLKDLLITIIGSGLRETNSDFFMSRGPCSLCLPSNYKSLKISDFYCAVLAREGYDPTKYGLHKYNLGEVRWNQSKRMQFNGWKFWYGNLNPTERTIDQYWFIPPGMPDVANEEHTLHGEHRENGVIQSIRSPGALQLRTTDGKEVRKFMGVYDTRAARSDQKELYEQREILLTIQHRVWLGEVLQSLADFGIRKQAPIQINFFDKDFHSN